jgi:hypothetical protein
MGFVRKIARKIDDEILQPIKHTVEAILDDPKKIAMVALSVFAPGVGTALGSAMGLSGSVATLVGNAAVNTALNGGDVKAGILAAAIPVVGQEAASLAASSFIDAGMDTALAQSAGKVVAGAGIATVQGKDPLSALISGGLSEGTAAITRDIPGFADLPESAKRSINAAVATGFYYGSSTTANSTTLTLGTLVGTASALGPQVNGPNILPGSFIASGTTVMNQAATATKTGITLWFNNASYQNVGGSSLAQRYLHPITDRLVPGTGEKIFTFFTNSSGVTQQELSAVRDLATSIIGGAANNAVASGTTGKYPDGPDVITMVATPIGAVTSTTIIARLSWTEAQA